MSHPERGDHSNRIPGESRDPLCNGSGADPWVRGFAGNAQKTGWGGPSAGFAARPLRLWAAARKHQPHIGADLGRGIDPPDRLVEAELATGVGARDDDKIGVGLVALPAGIFDLGDEFLARDRVHLIGVVMRSLRVEL